MVQTKTSLHFERKKFYADIENVNAYICNQCGTRTIPGDVAKSVSKVVESLFEISLRKPMFTGLCFHKVTV
jgi:hypothetical protein